MGQVVFNPVNFGFAWVDGWYEFDRKAAEKAARQARDAQAREMRKSGRRVHCFSLPSQLISRGGIGSGQPHIELVVNCYGLNVY